MAPAKMVSAFASLAAMEESAVTELAESLGRMEDFKGWEGAEVLELIRSVGDQAEAASAEGKTLVIYTCL